MGEIADMMIEAEMLGLDYEVYCQRLVGEADRKAERKRAKRKRAKLARRARRNRK